MLRGLFRTGNRTPLWLPGPGGVTAGSRPSPGMRAVAALLLCAGAFQVAARDVAQEQAAVQYARQEFEKAEAGHKADQEQAARTAKALGALKKQYDEELRKASESDKNRQQAKLRLEKAEEALDRAWNR